MAVYLTLSLLISAFMNWYNRASRWWSAEAWPMSHPEADGAAILPPVTERPTAIGWLRRNLFDSPFNTVLTLLIVLLVWNALSIRR